MEKWVNNMKGWVTKEEIEMAYKHTENVYFH